MSARKCATPTCRHECRVCAIMNDPSQTKLDIGDFVVLGHVMAMAAAGKNLPPLGGLHLCLEHKAFAAGALVSMRVPNHAPCAAAEMN